MIEGFKSKYNIAIIGFVLSTIVGAIIVYFNNCLESVVTVVLGGIAIVTSILAVGLADRKQKKLKVILEVWKIRDTHTISEGNQQVTDYAFEILNKGKESLSDFVVSFRFPDRNYKQPTQDRQNNRFFWFGESVVIQNDTLKYIGINNQDNSVRFEHQLKNIDNWCKGNFVITVSAYGFLPKTFVLRFQDRQILLDSKNENKITIEE